MQKVKDIFSDYSSEQGNICEADFLKANLYKKSNRLEVCLTSANKISIGEISEFEDYIVDRFKVGSARIEIQYENIDVEPTIENDWQDLVTYMSRKAPMTRAILRNSTVIVDDSTVCVDLKIKGADLLSSKKFDKGLEHLIYNLYNKRFKVKFEEDPQKSKEEYDKYLKEQEHEAILHIQEMARREAEERAKAPAPVATQIDGEEANEEHIDVEQSNGLIIGKTSTFRSKFASISDINDSTTKVNVEGEVINVTSRDIKNNRTIISFSIDDGNASITCKSFVDTNLVPGIMEHLKEGQGVKVDGNAKFDDYANEITIMANNVVISTFKLAGKESSNEKASVSEGGEAEQSPLIYGRSLNIKAPKTKIIDINNDTDRVCLEGEVISTDTRDIKGDRTILMFNLYDGTSTMTMKAFIETKKTKEVLGRLKNAKGIKNQQEGKTLRKLKELNFICTPK